MSATYLTVPFREKDAAKALGARWDGAARRWYVPAGQSLAPFAAWLPASPGDDLIEVSPSTAVQAGAHGIPLSRLLHGVARVVADAFVEGVWVTAEVLRASAKNGHVYLELSERDPEGRVLAKANAAIWAATAQRIVPEFERATGTVLGAGIKLLVRARPVYKAQFGFSLDIDAIDPTYTLGDLEAKKQEIRDRLRREQIFDLNQRLPAPWDYAAVLVVAPQGGAGLGDFAKEADRLERFGVCRFTYLHCRFQGESAAAEIQDTIRAGLARFAHDQPPDAIILIRGGGAVNDLAWLNDYALARFLCECPIPVLTGIGHERDRTVLDEVAHRAFDTPSKVIAGIEHVIAQRARDLRLLFESILQRGQRDAERTRTTVERLEHDVKTTAAATLVNAHACCAHGLAELRLGAMAAVHRARGDIHEHVGDIQARTGAQLTQAKLQVPARLGSIATAAFAALQTSRWRLGATLPAVLDRAQLDIQRSRSTLHTQFGRVVEQSRQSLHDAAMGSQALVREIAGQGPHKTLSRGFAMVRDSHGNTLTRAASTAAAGQITLVFQDGQVEATAHRMTPGGADTTPGQPEIGDPRP